MSIRFEEGDQALACCLLTGPPWQGLWVCSELVDIMGQGLKTLRPGNAIGLKLLILGGLDLQVQERVPAFNPRLELGRLWARLLLCGLALSWIRGDHSRGESEGTVASPRGHAAS